MKLRRPQSRRGFTRQPENSKRRHLRAPALQKPPQLHERTPKRRKKERKLWRERQKARNFGLPPFGLPPFAAPPFGEFYKTARELQTCTFQVPSIENTTKIPREDTQERQTERERSGGGRGGKKREILGPPTLRGTTPPFGAPKGVCSSKLFFSSCCSVFFLLTKKDKRLKHKIGQKSAWPKSATKILAKIGQLRLAKVGQILFGQSRFGQSRPPKFWPKSDWPKSAPAVLSVLREPAAVGSEGCCCFLENGHCEFERPLFRGYRVQSPPRCVKEPRFDPHRHRNRRVPDSNTTPSTNCRVQEKKNGKPSSKTQESSTAHSTQIRNH